MAASISQYKLSELSAAQRAALLKRSEDNLGDYLPEVQRIVNAVRSGGDRALCEFAAKFDRAKLEPGELLVSAAEFDAAERQLAPQLKQALEFAADGIRAFHVRQMPSSDWLHEFRPGVFAGERVTPVASAACYAPRGKGSFPSVALMTVIPAKVAGVPSIMLLTPPDDKGRADPATLYAAKIGGADLVAKVGGAQAVAAAAFGTDSIPRCRKFEGPGSSWVAAARRLLAGHIESRLPAGPSESIIFADGSAEPQLAALDLLIEAEHGADSSAFLVTCDAALAQSAAAAAAELLQQMDVPWRDYAAAVLGGGAGGIVLAADLEQAYAFVNDCAPEHLQIMSAEPERHLERIDNAGEILLGPWTPGSIANYLLGPSCVLPTARRATTHSPLGVFDFLKRSSVARLDERGYRLLAGPTGELARYEGFCAHARAVSPLREQLAKAAGSGRRRERDSNPRKD